ncbi:MAG: ATP-dependent RecD-like DNA helicase [Candidatus Aminicenantaceae bacterium]
MSEYMEGTIKNILFNNPVNGYTVCDFILKEGEIITIVGNFPPLNCGESLKVKGEWVINQRFGKQFKVENFIPVLPSSVRGIQKFLSSGMIKGVGPVLAKSIINVFGEKTLEILSNRPDQLSEVPGVGKVILSEIKRSWKKHEHVRNLIIFLQEHNVSTRLASRIYTHYGEESFKVLKSNPYQLCHDVWGIGFKTADRVAINLGISPSSKERIKAYIRYLLEKDNEEGHVFSLQRSLEENSYHELGVSPDRVREAISELIEQNLVVSEKLDSDISIYIPFFFKAQEEIVNSIKKLVLYPVRDPNFILENSIKDVEKDFAIQFSEKQKLAVKKSFLNKILVITGGPGTGKTTIIKALVTLYKRWGKKILLSAPTGRAAKRLSEATGEEAKTIHRTLEYNPKLGTFRRGENFPLKADILVIDEFSMVDVPLMYRLLVAVPPWMRLVLVGDKDQLPSVGPGNLLSDIIESKKIEVVILDKIFRQEKNSLIVYNAHRINQGKKLIYPSKGDKDSDFYFISLNDEQKVFDMIITLCASRIPEKLGLTPISLDIQVISPMYKGLVGVNNLNRELQKKLNPYRDGLKRGNIEMRIQDKVMQIKNNYQKEIFNGDIGTIVDIDKQTYQITVDFDGKAVVYRGEEMNEIVLAYAISVHKSQGSEYQAVVIPLLTQHYIMLQRNLLYTALTRAKRLSVVVGSHKALYIAINNNKPVKRNSLVKQKLEQSKLSNRID